ncbi:ATP-dependent zinc protease [Gilvimarinus xylanilyticus]|uniref:RimK/LysX family protein n=1 Tax=Gilvimarinus xylanilyticus TaxID=2944139 RepID=A0A9X2I4H7_9GAMM|nr:RimK/LysX family protein [Gilvimarinus xylanilyticus]MCP8900518.1 RimK/LysX family protein [Gilvimarinus xylanilyticus]
MSLWLKWAPVLLLVLGSGCASQYRLVQTSELETVQECAMASDHNHRVLLSQQQELARGLDELLSELEQTRAQIPAPAPTESALQCPDVPYVEPSTDDDLAAQLVDQGAKQVVGSVEQVRFDDLGLESQVRIDTGISNAILPAKNIQPFERNGEDWVRFVFVSREGDEREVERKLTREVSLAGSDKQRPVVRLRFTLGRLTQFAEFTLTERKSASADIRLGRLALRDVMVVDVSSEFLAPLRSAEGDAP